jgi:putative ABC transport system permease protein
MFAQESFNFNLRLALQALAANKLRSMLTALGVIFGVAAVITMLAIGAGAQKELLDQMKLVGANNIVVSAKLKTAEEQVSQDEKSSLKKFSNGLSLTDLQAIQAVLPNWVFVNPEVVKDSWTMREGIRKQSKLVGVDNSYFDLTDFRLENGSFFNAFQQTHGEPVCVVGSEIKAKFFKGANPVGKYIKSGENWLKVVGVLKPRTISENSIKSLGIRDFNLDVYIPIKTMLLRYQNRSLITKSMIEKAAGEESEEEETQPQSKDNNYHQLDKITIQLKAGTNMQEAAEVVSKLLERRHGGVVDFEVSIPELLIRQQQKTKDIFNFVLGAIAGISLLVGGIGIMNIMLASVLERTKEIGVRRAIGAKQNDVVQQFLLEAVLLSLGGALIGLALGISMSWLVDKFAGIETIISWWSVVLSMAVSVAVGLIFGITPASRASKLDPVEALRYE